MCFFDDEGEEPDLILRNGHVGVFILVSVVVEMTGTKARRTPLRVPHNLTHLPSTSGPGLHSLSLSFNLGRRLTATDGCCARMGLR